MAIVEYTTASGGTSPTYTWHLTPGDFGQHAEVYAWPVKHLQVFGSAITMQFSNNGTDWQDDSQGNVWGTNPSLKPFESAARYIRPRLIKVPESVPPTPATVILFVHRPLAAAVS